jgi:hypothetical protein
MSKKKYFSLIVLIITFILVIFLLVDYSGDDAVVSAQVNTEKVQIKKAKEEFIPRVSLNEQEAKLFKQLLSKVMEYNRNHPVEYPPSVSYRCKVVDQHGNAVKDAKYWINYNKRGDNKQIPHGSYNLKTDENGLFQFIINDQVSRVTVAVSKLGYKPIEGKSLRYLIQKSSVNNNFANSEALTKEESKTFSELLPRSGLFTQDESRENEELKIFVVHKMSDYDKMFSFSVESQDPNEKIPGKYMMEFRNQNSDGIVPDGAHVIQIGPCFYHKDKEKQIKIEYADDGGSPVVPAAPWFCEMSIPGGGFFLIDEKIEPDGDLYQSSYSANTKAGEEFLAPESGYEETVRAEISESMMNENWRFAITRNYYVKFSDNTYGRLNVRFSSGLKYSITSWYNPTGRRNTEFCLEDDLDVKYIEKKR